MSVDICTWNIGSHTDYRRLHPDFADASNEDVRLQRDKLFQHAFQSTLLSPVGVYAFQEIHAEDWPGHTANLLVPPHFDLFADHSGRDRDTVVAWDTRRFDRVAGFPIAACDNMWFAAAVHLACKDGGAEFVVCSAHVIGFNQAASEASMVAQAEMGDLQLREILSALDHYSAVQKKKDLPVFICGDLNADLAVYDKRHRILELDHGYRLVSTSTVYTFWDDNLNRAVTIDYIYSRHVGSKNATPIQTPFIPIIHEMGPADHLPVVVRVVFPSKDNSCCIM